MHDWEDCTQDTMLELIERLPKQQLSTAIEQPSSPARRELMRSVWCVAQRWRRAGQRKPVSLDIVGYDHADRTINEEQFDHEELSAAIQNLSATQQQILKQYCEGSSIAEIAADLDLPAARVSDQKYKAIRELKKSLSPPGSIT